MIKLGLFYCGKLVRQHPLLLMIVSTEHSYKNSLHMILKGPDLHVLTQAKFPLMHCPNVSQHIKIKQILMLTRGKESKGQRHFHQALSISHYTRWPLGHTEQFVFLGLSGGGGDEGEECGL